MPSWKGSYTGDHSFHAYDSSRKSTDKKLVCPLHNRTGQRIKNSCKESVGTFDSALSIQITHTITQIELRDSQFNKIEEEIIDIMKFNESVIMTILGIGYINGGMIPGEIGNIHRFSSPGKLLAFAGLDPSVYQSGNFQARRTKM